MSPELTRTLWVNALPGASIAVLVAATDLTPWLLLPWAVVSALALRKALR